MEVALTPRFFDKHLTAWSPSKTEPHNYVSLAFNGVAFNADHWHANYTTMDKTTSGPPTTIYILAKHDDDDDNVSLLHDDPDEDDDQLLPSSTYDVLAPLLDEMYKDDSDYGDEENHYADDDDNDNEQEPSGSAGDSVDWNETTMADGARAA
mmetsp:Transcript_119197/g.342513  ORF Transcript_119197/g.342513 Transcript_119197/m.342513 type:complete len:152 (-) Transcript_119197:525-980(-)